MTAINKELTIIIVNYKAKKVLKDCLKSLIENYSDRNFQIIVVDNPSDESIEGLENEFPTITFIYNTNNNGFAAGNNLGIDEALGKYILLLNPDTVVNKNSFSNMISILELNENIGVVGCKIFNKEGEVEHSTHSFPSLIKEFMHANEFLKSFIQYNSSLGRLFSRFIKVRAFDSYWNHDSEKDVDHVTGACMMIKRKVIDEVGLLDEAFFLYTEEVEWSFRIKKAGYRIVFNPNSDIIHLFGFSTNQNVQRQTINALLVERYRGMFYFFKKHYGVIKLFFLRLIVLQGFTFRLLWNFLLSGSISKDKSVLKRERKFLTQILALVFKKDFDWRSKK